MLDNSISSTHATPRRARGAARHGHALALLLLGALGPAVGCSDDELALENELALETPVETAAQELTSIPTIPDEALQKTLAPLRALEVPGRVYMRSVEETFAGSGTFSQVVHVYQPDANGETIRFELAAKTSTGQVDTSHGFQSVKVTSRPGESDEIQQTQPNSSGQRVYDVPGSRQGWYRFELTYVAPNAGRTLSFRAYDASGNSLKIVWVDPPSAAAQVRAKVAVDASASPVFLKGGAYRNTDPSQFAYADNVKVNGNLLYRRGFDQGQYNFPLGQLNAAEHTLEFSLAASAYNPAKFWFGVSEKSFARAAAKASWDRVQFLYQGAMRTGDYDAWSEGVAFAQGATVANGVRPPPVRRGTTFSVAVEDSSLNGTQNATVRIISDATGAEVSWAKSLPAEGDYRGGIFANGAFSSRNREHWRITVPSDAPVGRYYARAFAPWGARIGQDVVFYVIHNPYPLVASGAISKAELETYGYDEDEDGVDLNGGYGSDQDNIRDHFTVLYEWSPPYDVQRKLTGAFRRTTDESKFSFLDHAVAAAQGTTSEIETMRRLYRLVTQRYRYSQPTNQGDVSNIFLSDGLDPAESLQYAKPNSQLSWEDGIGGVQCYDYAPVLASIARSAGVLSRVVSSDGNLGGWGNHFFTEAYIPSVPHHGGKTQNSSSAPNSDTVPWYAFDATNPDASGSVPYQYLWERYSEAIAPQAQYGKAVFVLSGYKPRGTTTNTVTWDPLGPTDDIGADDVLSLQAAYESGPDFWLTQSGVTGILGRGEKDVYRISKATTGARAVSVSTVPGGGNTLQPVLCVGPYVDPNGPPAESEPGMPPRWNVSVPVRCADRATTYPLPEGESYVVVFHDHGQPDDAYPDSEDRLKLGDSVQYVLDLQY
ncbi:transglutaminase-like domain-containing protein [Sorangium cellulosum]|uniref:transglutaminase-like domain-containing protein n=1 Tax=Sorangium cellulosum TaxID=56 RepID=UPI0009B8B21C|nr:transglutaminase domain-containing protein [Sorangium cellulosum]